MLGVGYCLVVWDWWVSMMRDEFGVKILMWIWYEFDYKKIWLRYSGIVCGFGVVRKYWFYWWFEWFTDCK